MVGDAAPPAPSASPATGPEHEAREEMALRSGAGDIYGIPRAEWLRLQMPARYLGGWDLTALEAFLVRRGSGRPLAQQVQAHARALCPLLAGRHRAHATTDTMPRCVLLRPGAGNEFGAVHKPWDSATIRFSLTYPEIYEVRLSSRFWIAIVLSCSCFGIGHASGAMNACRVGRAAVSARA